MKKNITTILLIAGGAGLAYYLYNISKKDKKRVSVTADNPIPQTLEQYERDFEATGPMITEQEPQAITPGETIKKTASAIFAAGKKILTKKPKSPIIKSPNISQLIKKGPVKVTKKGVKKVKKSAKVGFTDLMVLN